MDVIEGHIFTKRGFFSLVVASEMEEDHYTFAAQTQLGDVFGWGFQNEIN